MTLGRQVREDCTWISPGPLTAGQAWTRQLGWLAAHLVQAGLPTWRGPEGECRGIGQFSGGS